MAENIREIVLDTLLVLEKEKDFSHTLIKAVLDKYDYLDGRDKGFLKRVTEGTLERRLELDYYLNHFSKVPVNKMKPLIRCLLRMSVYQLIYMDFVPDSAVCNEACKLAVKRHFQNLKGYVNGVLRAVSRSKDNLPLPDAAANPVEYLSVKYSMPDWLVELWMDEYGPDITATILEGLLEIHPVSLRFSTRLTSEEREELCAKIKEENVQLEQSRYLPYVYRLRNAEGIGNLPGFAQGRFLVQDVSSALAVEAAGISCDDFVLDVCAAPGGKSILAAEKAKQVLSRDVSEEKVILIDENLQRMRLANVETQVYDATCPDETLKGKADVVLADVPCSGLGILGKKRDIKYRVTPDSLNSLTQLQKQIVKTCVDYVKPGGTFLYSTCTIHRKENEDMVRFIAEELGLKPVSLKGVLSEEIFEADKRVKASIHKAGKDAACGLTQEEMSCCVQFLPGFMESDGFFVAKFMVPKK